MQQKDRWPSFESLVKTQKLYRFRDTRVCDTHVGINSPSKKSWMPRRCFHCCLFSNGSYVLDEKKIIPVALNTYTLHTKYVQLNIYIHLIYVMGFPGGSV